MNEKKLDLLAVALLFMVGLFLTAIGLVVAWETKSIAELFKFLSMTCFIMLVARTYYDLHVGENNKNK